MSQAFLGGGDAGGAKNEIFLFGFKLKPLKTPEGENRSARFGRHLTTSGEPSCAKGFSL